MSKIALFPGSFDPITLGHVDIIVRGLDLFEKIIVGIGSNAQKNYMFSLDDRIQFVKDSLKDYSQVEIMPYHGLTVEFCKTIHAHAILRGVRNAADFEYEKSIAQMNHAVESSIETVFLITSPQYAPVSSTIVRDLIRHGADVSSFIGEGVKL
ncbi:MAG: pantetheine-phosphate adenylyltransferase [Bacteroidota bacterium]